MKHEFTIILAMLAMMIPVSLYSEITIGDVSIPVEFEDKSLSAIQQTNLVSDLGTVFSVFPSVINAVNTNAAGEILFLKPVDAAYPEGLTQDTIWFSRKEDSLCLHASKELSDRYRNAWVLQSGYSNEVASLHAFLREIRSGAITNRTDSGAQELVYFLAHPEMRLSAEASRNVACKLVTAQFSDPSVLDLAMTNIGTNSLLISGSRIWSFDGYVDVIPWVFHDGIWSFATPN